MLIALCLWVVSLFSSHPAAAAETPERQLVRAGYSLRLAARIGEVAHDRGFAFADDPAMPDKVVAAFVRLADHDRATAEDLENFRVAGFRTKCLVGALGGHSIDEVSSRDFGLIAVDVVEAKLGADCHPLP